MKMKIGDKVIWMPSNGMANYSSSVTILAFSSFSLQPLVQVKWENGETSWVLRRDLIIPEALKRMREKEID